jgi:hypothetical protein
MIGRSITLAFGGFAPSEYAAVGWSVGGKLTRKRFAIGSSGMSLPYSPRKANTNVATVYVTAYVVSLTVHGEGPLDYRR